MVLSGIGVKTLFENQTTPRKTKRIDFDKIIEYLPRSRPFCSTSHKRTQAPAHLT